MPDRPADNGGGWFRHGDRGEGNSLGRGTDRPRQKAVGAVLDFDLVKPSLPEKARQVPRGRQEMLVE